MGDSYFGLIQKAPMLNQFYSWIFSFCSYTRNGLFYAPIFLLMGALIAKQRTRPNIQVCYLGFAISMGLMIVEGLLLHTFNLQRHTSMYLFLLPSMYFLFQILLRIKGVTFANIRDFSMWVYILHPLCIVAVRGAAKIAGLSTILVENSLVHYIAVCICSMALAAILLKCIKYVGGRHVSKSKSLD